MWPRVSLPTFVKNQAGMKRHRNGFRKTTTGKQLVAFALIFLLSCKAAAKDNPDKNEISFSAGTSSLFSTLFQDFFSPQLLSIQSVPLCVTYRHYFSKHVALGVSGCFEYLAQHYGLATSRTAFYTICPDLLVNYYRYNPEKNEAGLPVSIYGSLSVGCTHIVDKNEQDPAGEKYNAIGFQLTPLGMAFGNNIRGHVEMGLGYKGLINIGVGLPICKNKKQSSQNI